MYVTATVFLAAVLALTGLTCLVLALRWSSAPHGTAGRASHAPAEPDTRTELQEDIGLLNVEHEVREAVARVAADRESTGTWIDLAVQPGLWVRADTGTVRAMLMELLLCAMRDASCRRVLLSAVQQSGRVRIAVTDDGLAATTESRAYELRHIGDLVALQGGSMQIDVYPDQGTTVALGLPIPHVTGRPTTVADRFDARRPACQPADWPQTVPAGDL